MELEILVLLFLIVYRIIFLNCCLRCCKKKSVWQLFFEAKVANTLVKKLLKLVADARAYLHIQWIVMVICISNVLPEIQRLERTLTGSFVIAQQTTRLYSHEIL